MLVAGSLRLIFLLVLRGMRLLSWLLSLFLVLLLGLFGVSSHGSMTFLLNHRSFVLFSFFCMTRSDLFARFCRRRLFLSSYIRLLVTVSSWVWLLLFLLLLLLLFLVVVFFIFLCLDFLEILNFGAGSRFHPCFLLSVVLLGWLGLIFVDFDLLDGRLQLSLGIHTFALCLLQAVIGSSLDFRCVIFVLLNSRCPCFDWMVVVFGCIKLYVRLVSCGLGWCFSPFLELWTIASLSSLFSASRASILATRGSKNGLILS